MKSIRFLIVLILTALSSVRMNKLEKHQRHHSKHKITFNKDILYKTLSVLGKDSITKLDLKNNYLSWQQDESLFEKYLDALKENGWVELKPNSYVTIIKITNKGKEKLTKKKAKECKTFQ